IDVLGAALEERDRADRVPARRMRQPDRELGQTSPEFALGPVRNLPRVLEDLVGVERLAVVEQLLRLGKRLRRGALDTLRLSLDAAGWSCSRRTSTAPPWPTS